MAKKQAAAEDATKTDPKAVPAPAPEKAKKPAKEKKPTAEKEEKSTKPSKAPKTATEKAAPEAASPPEVAAPPPPKAKAAAEPGKKKTHPGSAPSRGKKLKNHLRNIQQKLQKDGPQPLNKAVATLKSLKRAKFDETVEIHMHLGVDAAQSDQTVRGTVSLPNGIGKTVRVAVFCQGDNVAKVKAAGADFVGGADLAEKIQKENFLDFDVAIATQDMMSVVGRLGKVLGPRGLMPTPKAGTVIPLSADVGAAVKEFKAGKVEYRCDKGGNVHAGVGKLSFDENKLVENINAFIEQIRSVKPAGIKGHYILSTTISATMSPGIRVAL